MSWGLLSLQHTGDQALMLTTDSRQCSAPSWHVLTSCRLQGVTAANLHPNFIGTTDVYRTPDSNKPNCAQVGQQERRWRQLHAELAGCSPRCGVGAEDFTWAMECVYSRAFSGPYSGM
jgi:hypothetical protein